MIDPEENQVLSPEEFEERLLGLSKADVFRLEKIARLYARQSGLDCDDLLQEAVTRALEGRRHCPRGVGVVGFLAGVLKSLSSDENKARARKPGHLSLVELAEAGFDSASPVASPEEQWHAQRRVEELWGELSSIFSDDEIALGILEYLMVGYGVEEVLKDFGLNQREYDSKRRFIRRRIDRHFRQEGRV